MSSAAGRHGYAFRTPYSAAKWGVVGFTQSLAKELGTGIASGSTPSCPASSTGRASTSVIGDRAKPSSASAYAEMEKRSTSSKVSLRTHGEPLRRCQRWWRSCSPTPGVRVSGQSLGVDGNVEAL
jgi:NAD(P)-dependent dehydrogenase (short-subunit alcohol dehydrogenase family)